MLKALKLKDCYLALMNHPVDLAQMLSQKALHRTHWDLTDPKPMELGLILHSD